MGMIHRPQRRVWDGTILLVADPQGDQAPDGVYDRRIDRPVTATVEALRTALESTARRVTLISDLGELTDRAGRHTRSLVFPYWFGERSRSRHGLVPAICEANEIMFVGADAFTKIVCNDKELSKVVCSQSGLDTPASGIVRTLDQMRHVRHLRLPVIVKPNYEGTSLGISERNKCYTWADAEAVAADLLRELGQPLVIEEFISGREFSACLMQTRQGIRTRVGAWTVDGSADYLDDRVFSADLKTSAVHDLVFEERPDMLAAPVLEAMADCFHKLGKVELLRIDGRLRGEDCRIIELTPDIYLGADGEFATAHRSVHGGYDHFVSDLVRNCVEGYGAEFPV